MTTCKTRLEGILFRLVDEVGDASPGQVSAVTLVKPTVQLSCHGRSQTVGTDQCGAFDVTLLVDPHHDRRFCSVVPTDSRSRPDRSWAQSVGEYPDEHTAVDTDQSLSQGGDEVVGLDMNPTAAVRATDCTLTEGSPEPTYQVPESKHIEGAKGIRPERDSRTLIPDAPVPLQDDDFKSSVLKRYGQREAANSRTRDDDRSSVWVHLFSASRRTPLNVLAARPPVPDQSLSDVLVRCLKRLLAREIVQLVMTDDRAGLELQGAA